MCFITSVYEESENEIKVNMGIISGSVLLMMFFLRMVNAGVCVVSMLLARSCSVYAQLHVRGRSFRVLTGAGERISIRQSSTKR